MSQHEEQESEQEIVEKINYLNSVIIPSIRAIDNAIENEKSTKYLPKNLTSNLPKMWRDEIKVRIDSEKCKLDAFIDKQSIHFRTGTTQSEKDRANELINDARVKYSQDIKEIVIDLIQEKVGLFQTRKKVETGYIDLYEEMGLKPDKEEDD